MLRAFLRKQLTCECFKFVPLRLGHHRFFIARPPYSMFAFSRISSMSFDACALVRLSSNNSGNGLGQSPRALARPKVKAEMRATIRIACEKPSREGEEIRYDRPVLGNLDARKRLLEAYLLLPAAHVTRLTSIAASDRIKVVRLMATKLIGRKALVRSVNLFTEV